MTFAEQLASSLGMSADTANKLLLTAGIVVGIILLRWGLLLAFLWRKEDSRLRYRWRKVSAYGALLVALILVGRIWLAGVESLITYLGLVSAGIAIALKDPILNIIGWVFVSSRRPFVVGDRVAVGEHTGDVIDISLATFSILEVWGHDHGEQTSGRIIHIPNGVLLSQPLANFTQGFNYVWNEIPVTVTFESDWRAAKETLQRIVAAEADAVTLAAEQGIRRAGRRFMLHPESTEPAVYTRIAEDGVELTIRYLCEPKRRRITTQAIGEAILEAFSEAPRIDFAYRTSRIFRQTEEGKATLRPTAESS